MRKVVCGLIALWMACGQVAIAETSLDGAAAFLRAQGYTPDYKYETRIQGLTEIAPNYCVGCPEVVSVTLWVWEDYNPEVGTGILHERQTNGETRTTVVQILRDGQIIGKMITTGWDIQPSSNPLVLVPNVSDADNGAGGGPRIPGPIATDEPVGTGPVDGWGWTPRNSQLAKAYLCAGLGCGSAALVAVLFKVTLSTMPKACTSVFVACGVTGVVYGF